MGALRLQRKDRLFGSLGLRKTVKRKEPARVVNDEKDEENEENEEDEGTDEDERRGRDQEAWATGHQARDGMKAVGYLAERR